MELVNCRARLKTRQEVKSVCGDYDLVLDHMEDDSILVIIYKNGKPINTSCVMLDEILSVIEEGTSIDLDTRCSSSVIQIISCEKKNVFYLCMQTMKPETDANKTDLCDDDMIIFLL